MNRNSKGLLDCIINFGAGMFLIAIPILYLNGFFNNIYLGLFILGSGMAFFVSFLINIIYYIIMISKDLSKKQEEAGR